MSGDHRTLRPRRPGAPGRRRRAPVQTTSVAPKNPDVLTLLADEPHVAMQSGQVLFAEGDPPKSMYVVKSGTLRIRSGGVVYEDVERGGIVGEMALVEHYPARSATVYAMTDSELVAIDEARFLALIAETPYFALRVMQTLSRRLRSMDLRYRPGPLIAREPFEP